MRVILQAMGNMNNLKVVGYAETLQDLINFFPSCGPLTEDVPVNVFYTVAHIKHLPPLKSRWRNSRLDFSVMDMMPWDIDGIGHPGCEEKRKIIGVIETLYGDRLGGSERYYNDSGYGLHFLVKIDPHDDPVWVDSRKAGYKRQAQLLTEEIHLRCGLQVKVDPVIWETARLLRVPNSVNRKDGREDALCCCLAYYGNVGQSDTEFLESWSKLGLHRASRNNSMVSEVLRYVDATKLEDHGQYVMIPCPFHKEQTPSFAIYKNGDGWGNDFHDGARVNPSVLLAQVSGQSIAAAHRQAYALDVPESMQRAEVIIGEWAQRKFEFIFRDNDRLYARVCEAFVNSHSFADAYDEEIITYLKSGAIEANVPFVMKPMSLSSITSLFRTWSRNYFAHRLAELPELKDLSVDQIPEGIAVYLRREIHNILYEKRMWSEHGTNFRRSFVDRILEGPNDQWVKIDSYSLWGKHQGYDLTVGFNFHFLSEVNPKWSSHMFRDGDHFKAVMTAIGAAKGPLVLSEEADPHYLEVNMVMLILE